MRLTQKDRSTMTELPHSFPMPKGFDEIARNIRSLDESLDKIVEGGLNRVGWNPHEATVQKDAAQIRRSARLMVLLGTFEN